MTERKYAARERRAYMDWVRRCATLDASVWFWEKFSTHHPDVVTTFYPGIHRLEWWMQLYGKSLNDTTQHKTR